MATALFVVLVILTVVAGYAFVAGRVFKSHNPPRPCGGKNRMSKYDTIKCGGPYDICWYMGHACADCVAYRKAMNAGMLWIPAWFIAIPRKAFRMGADTVLPRPPTPDAELDAIERELNEELRKAK